MYYNWDTVTAAIVVSKEVDKQECGEFFDQFKQLVEVHILGRKQTYEAPAMNETNSESDTQAQLYLPLQTSNAQATMRIHENKVDTFITQWNNNPDNRSKIGLLRQSLEETKDVLVEDLEEVTKRG